MKTFDILGEIFWYDREAAERHEKNQSADYPLKSREEIAVDVPPPEIFGHSVKEGLFSGRRIGADPFRGKLDTLEKMTGPVHIDLIRVRLDYVRLPEGEASGISYEEFARRYYDRCFDFALKHPDRTMLCAIAEFDSSCPWPQERCFATRQEGFEFFRNAVKHMRIGSGDPETLFKRLRERNLSFEDARLMAHGACLFALHYYFEWGFPHVELERGIGASCNMQISMAYLRGAWKQYGRKSKWGVDYSTHNTNFNRLNHYTPDGKRFGGRTESLIIRSYLLSYLAGADYLLSEGHELTHYVYQADGSFELSRLGKEAKKFADYTLRSGRDRGTPVVPVAIMLSYVNGYDSHASPFGKPTVWGNCYPYGLPEAHITNVFEFFCPGFIRANDDGNPAFCDVPWKTRQEMLNMQFAGMDMRPYERGFIVPSVCGDCFDVLLDNAGSEVLSEYPVLILAGNAAPDTRKLLEYMEQGGTLCAAVNQVTPELLSALGMERQKRFNDDWDVDTIFWKDGDKTGGMRYSFARFTLPEKATVLAENHRKFPIVVEVPCGKGKLLFSTVDYAQDVPGNALLFCWQRALKEEIAPHFPVKADAPGLELLLNRTAEGWLLGVFNNNGTTWEGTVELDGFAPQRLRLAPFEARVIRCEANGAWQTEYIVDC